MSNIGDTPAFGGQTAPEPQSGDVYVDGLFVTAPSASDEQHLLDSDFASPLSRAALKHLADCGWCGRRAAIALERFDPDDETAFLTEAQRRAGETAAQFQALTRLSPRLHELMDESYYGGDVEPGQIWRLRHASSTAVGLILSVERSWVTVAPVTTDVGAGDEYSLRISDTATVLGVPAAVCISLECVVPLITLDRLVAPAAPTRVAVSADQLPRAEDIRAVWLAWRRGEVPPVGLTYGQPVMDGDLDRRELRNAVAAEFEPMIGARARLASAPEHLQGPSLSERLKGLGRPPSELARDTGLGQDVFKRIGQNKRITLEEARALASVLHTEPESVLAANPPLAEALVLEIMKPRWRPSLRLLASHQDPPLDEDAQREAIAEAVSMHAARTVAHAASQTMHGGDIDWASVIEMSIRTQLTAHGDSIPGDGTPSRLEG